MLKLKYYSLNKEEKKKIKEEFYNTEFGKNIKFRLNRLLITGILGVLFSIYLFISSQNKWNVVYAFVLLIASLVFIIGSYKVRIDKINRYLVTKKNKK